MPFVWRRGRVYQYRRRLPKKLTELGSPALLCLSLRTEVLPEAMKRAAAIIAAVERVEAEVTTNLVRMIIRQAFIQPDRKSAGETWRHVADQLRGRWPKLAALMDEAEEDVLAYMTFPSQHRVKLHSTNPLERLNKEVKRRADVVGIWRPPITGISDDFLPLSWRWRRVGVVEGTRHALIRDWTPRLRGLSASSGQTPPVEPAPSGESLEGHWEG